jgi:hypothetical protein
MGISNRKFSAEIFNQCSQNVAFALERKLLFATKLDLHNSCQIGTRTINILDWKLKLTKRKNACASSSKITMETTGLTHPPLDYSYQHGDCSKLAI